MLNNLSKTTESHLFHSQAYSFEVTLICKLYSLGRVPVITISTPPHPAPAFSALHTRSTQCVIFWCINGYPPVTCFIGCKAEGLVRCLKELRSLRRLCRLALGSGPELKLGCRSPEDVWEHSVIYTYIRCFIRRMSTGYEFLCLRAMWWPGKATWFRSQKEIQMILSQCFPKCVSKEPSSQETRSCKIKFFSKSS